MIDLFYAFLAFAVLISLELLATLTWFGPYYRIGVPVVIRRRALAQPQDAAVLTPPLNTHFINQPLHPSIQFHVLDAATLAFRERFFENRGGFKYLPVLHSLVMLDPKPAPGAPGGSAAVIGYVDWYVIYILIYMLIRSMQDDSFAIVAILVLFVLALSLITQLNISAKVADEITALAAAPEAETPPAAQNQV